MNETPWHLEALGLPPHADAVMVRRAYAARLRQLDPVQDPVAFQQLREAYESARAWCDEHPAEAKPEPQVAVVAAPAVSTAEPVSPVPVADDAARGAMQRLAEALGHHHGDDVAPLLDEVLASLRYGYIDAPGQFEDLFIDALRSASLDQRPALFDAGTQAFHWQDVGHLRTHAPRAAWVARVLAQREHWLTLDAGWRATWLELIARAQRGIDDYVARRWPDIGRLGTLMPDWLLLHLPLPKLQAWQAAFDNLPRSTREEFQQRAAPASALAPRVAQGREPRRRSRIPPTAWAIGWFVLMLVYLVANGLHTASQQGQGEPLPKLNEVPLTPRECMALYARFDAPDAFAGMPTDEVVQAKRRAQRCALNGHWRAPGGVNSAPGR